MDRDQARSLIVREVDEIASELVVLSDKIWANPETKHEEFKACGWLTEFLESHGLETKTKVGGLQTSFVGSRKNAVGKPKIGYLCEYDALPGIGHACGHNIIGVASAGAGIVLSSVLNKAGKDAAVTVFGCPGEEGGGGKVYLSRAGCFDGVDAAMDDFCR